MALGGRAQRKRGVEREIRVDSVDSPGQVVLEKSFISRGFSGCAEAAKTGTSQNSWRRIGDWGQTLSVAISMG
jgi:hypothetical protein